MSDESEYEGLSFEIANPGQSISQASRRDRPAATVNPSGLTPLNTGATVIIDGLAEEAGLDRDHYCVRLGANKAAGVVSCQGWAPMGAHPSLLNHRALPGSQTGL